MMPAHPNDIARKLDRHIEVDAMQWKLLCAYRSRWKSVMQDGRAVSINFDTPTEAEQFLKLLQSARGRTGR